MGKGSSESPRDDWGIGTGPRYLGHPRLCCRAVGKMSHRCPSPLLLQHQAAGEPLASDQTLHTASPFTWKHQACSRDLLS